MQQVRGAREGQPRGVGTGAKLLWLLFGMVLGAALARELDRRATPAPPVPRAQPAAALPVAPPRSPPSGRHAWVPPAGDSSDAS